MKDGGGDKAGLLPALLFQDLGCPRLLGVAQIELHGKPAQVFFIPHSIHLPEWDTR